MLTVSVLGPVSVSLDGTATEIGGARVRAVLAVLVAHLNEVVSTDRLLEEAWDGAPPRSGINALRVQINALRALLGPEAGVLETASPGYLIHLSEDQVDATRFESIVAFAEQTKDSNVERASELLDEAESLWRGRPYDDVEGEFADTERRRLAVVREAARACRFEVELSLGRHHHVLSSIDDAIEEAPYEERLWRSKMVALYRDGRHADALRVFRELGDALADIGLDPSPASAALELQILNHDPDLSETQRRATNVPSPTTSFIGREALVALVEARISEFRCVSLLGAGGIGKTRVAIESAHAVAPDMGGGTWFVDLTTLRDPDSVPTLCASQLGLFVPSGSSALDMMINWGATPDRLLIVDNCERVAGAAADLVTALLAGCPDLTVITTSRVRLGVPGEQIVQLKPMRTRRDDEHEPEPSDAAALLIERALQSQPELDLDGEQDTIEELASLLEGMPLALELAAAKLRHMAPAELLHKLGGHFDVLEDPSRTDSPHRRALNTTLEWSWDLLGADAAPACSILSLFRGGFTHVSAGAVLPETIDTDAVIAELIDASLLNMHTHAGATRFSFLESIRLFAIGRIAKDSDSIYRRRHAEYFAEVATASHMQLRSADQAQVRSALVAESANLRAAIHYAAQLADNDLEVKIAANAGNFWFETGQLDLGRSILTDVLANQDASEPVESLPELCRNLVELSLWSGAIDDARRFLEYEASLVDRSESRVDAAELRGSKALFSFIVGDYASSYDEMSMMLSDDAPARGVPRAYAMASIAYLLLRMGERERAVEAIERATEMGSDFGKEAVTAMRSDFEGWLAFHDGHLAAAEWEWSIGEQAYEALELYPMMADMRQLRAWAAIERGDEHARGLLASANQLMADYALRPFVIRGNILMAAANSHAEPRAALDRLRKELEGAARIQSRTAAVWGLVYASRCETMLGNQDAATALADRANTLRARVPLVWPDWLTDPLLLRQPVTDDDSTDREIIDAALAEI
ncbi:MAG: BTAD domain-containing putative transcriptional regulator [Actinomycetota bacterium]